MFIKFSASATVLLLAGIVFLSDGCKKVETAIAGIPTPTTLQLQFTTGGKTTVFNYRKTSNGVVADTIKVPRSTAYTGKTVVLDTTQNPAADLTQVYAIPNKRDFIVIYTFDPGTLPVKMEAAPSDVDDLGYSFGQLFTFNSFLGASGTVNVLVKYKSDKRIADPSQSGGTVLINATFPLKVL